MTERTLTRRELNRATLARQMLLERADVSVDEAVGRLVAMQMQEPAPVYVGLWSRVAGFRREDLADALVERALVRATAMRATLHLMTADDYVRFRGALGPGLEGAVRGVTKGQTEGWSIEGVVEVAQDLLKQGPATAQAMRDALVAAYPEGDERAMGYAARMTLPMVQVPSGGPRGFTMGGDFALAEQWLGQSVDEPSEDATRDLARRYLAAFGPATGADFETWSGLRGGRALLDGMTGELVSFRSEDHGKTPLYDLPDAPRSSAETPAPPRFLPAFDNLLLSYKERRRVISDEDRKRVYLPGNLRVKPSCLIDGEVAGAWRVERKRKVARLTIEPFRPLAELNGETRDALFAEGEALARFIEPEAAEWSIGVSET